MRGIPLSCLLKLDSDSGLTKIGIMLTTAQTWFMRLQGLNNLCLTQSLAVRICENTGGATVTCHCRSQEVAESIARLIRAGGMDDIYVKLIRKKNGPTHYQVVLMFDE